MAMTVREFLDFISDNEIPDEAQIYRLEAASGDEHGIGAAFVRFDTEGPTEVVLR